MTPDGIRGRRLWDYGFKSEEGAGRLIEVLKFLEKLNGEVAALERKVSERRTWKFADVQDQWQHDALLELVRGLEKFTGSDPKKSAMASMRERLKFARTIYQRSVLEYGATWDRAIQSIANVEECPQYKGLKINPQVGLVPIGHIPELGLWEFVHLQTGTIPKRRADGKLIITENTGLVFVLIPGGSFRMGAVKPHAKGATGSPNIDPEAGGNESPVHEVTLSPYFLSKYEMTQGQWLRFTGENPSVHGPDTNIAGKWHSLLHPVENISWVECHRVLRQLGFRIPTEAQWEYATRAGTTTAWSTGNERETLRGKVNLADKSAKDGGMIWASIEDWPDLVDGYVVHAPVGTYDANGFGLHDVHGNVTEWCRDWFGSYSHPVKTGDGEREVPNTRARHRIIRGGSCYTTARDARSADRHGYTPNFSDNILGIRPAMDITD